MPKHNKTAKDLLKKTAMGGGSNVNIESTFKEGDATLARGAEQFRASTAGQVAKAGQLGQGVAKREGQAAEANILSRMTGREREKQKARVGEQIRQEGRRDVATGQLASLEEQEAGRLQRGEQFEKSLQETVAGREQSGEQFEAGLQETVAGREQQAEQFQADIEERGATRLQRGEEFQKTLDLSYQQLDMNEQQFNERMGFDEKQLQVSRDQWDQKIDLERSVFDWEKTVTQKGIDNQDLALAWQAADGNPIAAGIIMKEVYANAGLEYTDDDQAAYEAWVGEEERIAEELMAPMNDLMEALTSQITGEGGTDTGGKSDTDTDTDTIGMTEDRLDETLSLSEQIIPADIERGKVTFDQILTTMEGKDWNNLSDSQLSSIEGIEGVSSYENKEGTPALFNEDVGSTVFIGGVPYKISNSETTEGLSEQDITSMQISGIPRSEFEDIIESEGVERISLTVENLFTGKEETFKNPLGPQASGVAQTSTTEKDSESTGGWFSKIKSK